MTDSEQNRTPASTGSSGPSASAASGIPASQASGSGAPGGADVRADGFSGRAARDHRLADEAEGEFAADAQAEILAAERIDEAASKGPRTERTVVGGASVERSGVEPAPIERAGIEPVGAESIGTGTGTVVSGRAGTSAPESADRGGAAGVTRDAGQAETAELDAGLAGSQGGGNVPPGAPTVRGRGRDRDSHHSRTAMVLGGTAIVLALALGAWTYNRFDRVESEVTRRLQTAEQRGAGIESSLQQSQNLVRDLQNRSSVLESRIAETAGLQAQLEKLYRERAEDTLEVLLVETEGALSLASQQLALGANPQGVLAALEDIERRLARQNEARLGPVQAALMRDIEMLRVYPATDVSSLALRIDALIGALDHLPLLASIRNPLETSNGVADAAPAAPAGAAEAPAQSNPPGGTPSGGTPASAATTAAPAATTPAAAPEPAAAPSPAPGPAIGQDGTQGQGQAPSQAPAPAQAQVPTSTPTPAPADGSRQVPAQAGSPAASQSSTPSGAPPATPVTEQASAQSAGDSQAGAAPAADEAGSIPSGKSAASPQPGSAQQSVSEQTPQTEPSPQGQAPAPQAPAPQAPVPQAPAPQASAPEGPAAQPSATPAPAPQQTAEPPADPSQQPAQPAATQPAPRAAASQPSTADSGSSRLAAAWNAVRKELLEVFNVRRIDSPDAMLMSPQQAYFLRQNLRLMLLNARLALLTRNEEVYRADLERARRWIGSYYDAEHRNVMAVQAQLRQLIDARLVLEPPRIDESLTAVRHARTTVR